MFFLTHAQQFKGPTWKNVVPQAQKVWFKCCRVKVIQKFEDTELL
jgi:hypothetical protein